jgi:hypothetical protein
LKIITVCSILKIGMETTGFASLGASKLGSSAKFMMKSLREPTQDITEPITSWPLLITGLE